MIQTTLQGIAAKAAREKSYRFRSLARMLSVSFLLWCWTFINKKAAAGVDKVSAKEYEVKLLANVEYLVEQLKGNRYKAKLVRRQYIPFEVQVFFGKKNLNLEKTMVNCVHWVFRPFLISWHKWESKSY